ncbi:MAG: mitochondrial fission ELM1 family protein [Pseudomonadota bacterium]
MTEAPAPLSCWVVTDGRRGIENQALGLAEAVARQRPVTIHRRQIVVRDPWRSLPRTLWGDPFSRLDRDRSSLLRPPYPDLWISTGRLAVPFAMAVRSRPNPPFVVQTQDPRAPSKDFDLIIPPHHDGLTGDKVFPILGSPNRLTGARLADDAALLAPVLAHLPSPRVAVLVGGDSRSHKLSPARAEEIAAALKALVDQGAGLMVTTSRRTPDIATARLKAALDPARAFFWTGEPVGALENPYFGMLGLADHVLVTEDTTNMAAEAAGTGKPVHVLALDGGSTKFDLFHRQLRNYGAARWFTGALDSWTYTPLRETDRAAGEIIRRFTLSRASKPAVAPVA